MQKSVCSWRLSFIYSKFSQTTSSCTVPHVSDFPKHAFTFYLNPRVYVCLCPLLPGGRVQMCPWLQCTGFQSSIEKCRLNEATLTCMLLLFLINTAWRVELLFDCGVTVVTCCLTFDSLQNERFVLPKWHFNKRWRWNEYVAESPPTSCNARNTYLVFHRLSQYTPS